MGGAGWSGGVLLWVVGAVCGGRRADEGGVCVGEGGVGGVYCWGFAREGGRGVSGLVLGEEKGEGGEVGGKGGRRENIRSCASGPRSNPDKIEKNTPNTSAVTSLALALSRCSCASVSDKIPTWFCSSVIRCGTLGW